MTAPVATLGSTDVSAAALTRRLLAPAGTRIDDSARHLLRNRLLTGVPPLVADLPPGEQVVITLALIRQGARWSEHTGAPDKPFSWKPAFVRRSLGLAAIEACLRHQHATPAEAVRAVADRAIIEWQRTGWRTYHWEPWYAGLVAGARATVLAEATTWGTAVWSALDWGQFKSLPTVGGPDDQWACPATRTVRLKGRSELRADIEGPVPGGNRSVALLAVSSGTPTDDYASELGFLALAASLRSPSRPVPARVVGLWPDAGMHRVVEVGADVATAAAERVLAVLRSRAITRSVYPPIVRSAPTEPAGEH